MEINQITEQIIGGAIEVHKALGPGLLEVLYEKALCEEFRQRGLEFEPQKDLAVTYKGRELGTQRLDLLVAGKIVVELKSVERLQSVHTAQVLGYMRLGSFPIGLLINFNSNLLKDGIKRFAL
jgi:GxxExxY protein